MKLLYLEVSAKSDELIDQWVNDRQVDQLYFHHDNIMNLISELESSNSMFPPARRNMNKFKVAHMNYIRK
jgi:hypothetical protein